MSKKTYAPQTCGVQVYIDGYFKRTIHTPPKPVAFRPTTAFDVPNTPYTPQTCGVQ